MIQDHWWFISVARLAAVFRKWCAQGRGIKQRLDKLWRNLYMTSLWELLRRIFAKRHQPLPLQVVSKESTTQPLKSINIVSNGPGISKTLAYYYSLAFSWYLCFPVFFPTKLEGFYRLLLRRSLPTTERISSSNGWDPRYLPIRGIHRTANA